MTIQVKYVCDGCHAEAAATTWPRRHFDALPGQEHRWRMRLGRFGHWRFDDFNTIAPEGWVPFDPYTGCCYCPKCWAEIEAPEPKAAE